MKEIITTLKKRASAPLGMRAENEYKVYRAFILIGRDSNCRLGRCQFESDKARLLTLLLAFNTINFISNIYYIQLIIYMFIFKY